MGNRMRRVVKYILAVVAVFLCLVVALWEYSSHQDHKNFSAAKNNCERGCIQDSGGIDQCRKFCAQHPEHYP
jgi:hypothetical protein